MFFLELQVMLFHFFFVLSEFAAVVVCQLLALSDRGLDFRASLLRLVQSLKNCELLGIVGSKQALLILLLLRRTHLARRGMLPLELPRRHLSDKLFDLINEGNLWMKGKRRVRSVIFLRRVHVKTDLVHHLVKFYFNRPGSVRN